MWATVTGLDSQAIAMLTGIDMVSDCVRLCVGLRMLSLSCLACFCTLVGVILASYSSEYRLGRSALAESSLKRSARCHHHTDAGISSSTPMPWAGHLICFWLRLALQLAQVTSSASPVATAAGGSVLIVFGGFMLPAAALACLELRSRLGFVGETVIRL